MTDETNFLQGWVVNEVASIVEKTF